MKWFANMKISKKLLLGFALVLTIAVAIGAVGIVNLTNISANDIQMYEYMTLPVGHLTQLTTSFQMIRVDMRQSILLNDPGEIAKVAERIAQFRSNLTEKQEEFAKAIQTERVQKTYEKYLDTRVVFGGYLEQVLKLAAENRDAEATALMQSDACYQAEQNEQNAILELVSYMEEDAGKKSEENSSLANMAMMTVLGVLIAGVILAILLALYISRIISGSMKKINVAAEGIADGDMSVEVNIDTKDEIGDLATTFRRMTGNLNEVLSGINAASEQVSLGAAELSNSSVSLSQGATEQASSIEEVTASLEQISSQTRQNAENATDANKLAGISRSSAEHGNHQMKDMLKAMEDINASSSSISKIIKVIDDIAFQTNILALNAAVEAARAGQHGKGFAVVAEEVRNLAAKSASAAKETTDMIESSIRKVEAGTKLAAQTAEELEKIVEGVAQTAVLVNQIDQASKEQAIGLAQINQAVMQVSQVVQANSAVSEQSAAASKELAGQAETMRDSVSKFKLKKDDAQEKFRLPAAETHGAESARLPREEVRPAKALGKRIISLSDGDFGKY